MGGLDICKEFLRNDDVLGQYFPVLNLDDEGEVEVYIGNDIGIFDEMPTPTPAIVLSDAYIGDECAVKELFKSTGKPILDDQSDQTSL